MHTLTYHKVSNCLFYLLSLELHNENEIKDYTKISINWRMHWQEFMYLISSYMTLLLTSPATPPSQFRQLHSIFNTIWLRKWLNGKIKNKNKLLFKMQIQYIPLPKMLQPIEEQGLSTTGLTSTRPQTEVKDHQLVCNTQYITFLTLTMLNLIMLQNKGKESENSYQKLKRSQ